MADKKISALTAATTPLAGTEVLPIVQSGGTKKVSIDNLTAGKDVPAANFNAVGSSGTTKMTVRNVNDYFGFYAQSGQNKLFCYDFYNGRDLFNIDTSTRDFNLNAGNFVPSTAAKGINFTANTAASGSTSQLFNWYDTGTFTPTFTNLTVVGTPTITGNYTRIGRMVYVNIRIQSTGSTSSVAGTTYANAGFPYVSANIYTAGTTINTSTGGSFTTETIFGLSGGNTIMYTATWTTLADVTITGFYFV